MARFWFGLGHVELWLPETKSSGHLLIRFNVCLASNESQQSNSPGAKIEERMNFLFFFLREGGHNSLETRPTQVLCRRHVAQIVVLTTHATIIRLRDS